MKTKTKFHSLPHQGGECLKKLKVTMSKKVKIVIPLILLILNSCSNDSAEMCDEASLDYTAQSGNEYTKLSGDKYTKLEENSFVKASEQPMSTFSIDADGASYSNIRRFILEENQLPPKAAIRTEELINYFDLDYPGANNSDPISLNGEVSTCPWNTANKLIRIGIKGKQIPNAELPPSNFVFLIDVSGSMAGADRLELLKAGFKLFVDEMSEKDRVAIVTYSGSAGVVLSSTPGNQKQKIKDAINSLGSGGSTAGAHGIITAYEIAQSNFIENGNNRVILGTDGDFNVGVSSTEELVKLIEQKRDLGIFITVLGVGRGTLNDEAMEQIADNGNGTYEYIDNLEQLKKVFIYEKNKFITVAKDVKVQVKFNPANVESYRLIGYENRILSTEDFKNDKKDAGEIGSGQNITALYEIVPSNTFNKSTPAFTIDFRYKDPKSDISIPMSLDIFDEGKTFDESSDYMKFTAGIVSYSMLICDSKYKGSSSYDEILGWLGSINLNDENGNKKEFKDIVQKTKSMQ